MIDEILIEDLLLSPSIREYKELYRIVGEIKSANLIGNSQDSIKLIENLKESHKLTKKEKIRCNLLFSMFLDDTNHPKEGLDNILLLRDKYFDNIENVLKYVFLVVHSRLLISLGEFDSGLSILNQAISLFSDLEDPVKSKYRVALKILEITIQYRKGNLDTTLESLQKELELIHNIGTVKDKAFVLNVLGVIFYQKGNLDKSLKYHQQSLEIRKEIGNKKWIAVALSNIGLVFYDKGNFVKALEFYYDSLTIFQEIQDKASISWTMNNIAIIYAHKGQLDKALDNYKECLSLSEDIGNKNLIALALNNIGGMYLEKTDYFKAIDNLQKSLSIYKEIGNKIVISSTLSSIALAYFLQKKLEPIEELLNDFPPPPYESLQIKGFKNMILAYSEQLRGNSGNAIKLWLTIIENKAIEFSDQVRALEALITLYFKSWKNTESDYDLEQINLSLNKLNDISYANYLIPSICKVLLIKAKMSLVQLDFENAENYLIEGLQKAHESGLPVFKDLFNKELNFFKKKLDKMLSFTSSSQSRFKQQQFQEISYSLQGIQKVIQEKEKSEELLLNILPKEVIPHLKESKSLYTEEFENVSVLFADMVGFTRLSTAISSKKMVYLLDEIFSYFDSLLDKFSAEKIRTIGDNYMVSVGVPKRRLDHAVLIANLALEMQKYLENPRTDGLSIKLRIGVNSGPVTASVIGKKKFQFDLLSETVNIASRMESHGVPGKIQITQETYNLIKDKFIFEKREKIEVKGMGEMSTWFLLERKLK
jgi:class 3 adenylate cyclase